MDKRQCGTSDLELSVLGLGTWQFGSKGSDDYWGLAFTDDMAKALVLKASNAGVTYFDTAEDYGNGGSEEQLGRSLEVLDEQKTKVIIGSKILPNHCSEVRKHCLATCARLKIPAIDLYMVHWPIEVNSMAHFAGAHTESGLRDYAATGEVEASTVPAAQQAFIDLKALQDEGLIRHIGVCNFGQKQLASALLTGVKIAVNQVCYSLIFRAAEVEILPFCKTHGIGVLGYSPLMQGLLSDKAIASADDIPTYRARSRHFSGKRQKSRHGEEGHEKLLFDTLIRLREIACEAGVSLSDLAIAWPLHMEGVVTVIAGCTSESQLESNIRAAGLKLNPDIVKRLTDATNDLKEAMGSNADLWQGTHADGKVDGRIR